MLLLLACWRAGSEPVTSTSYGDVAGTWTWEEGEWRHVLHVDAEQAEGQPIGRMEAWRSEELVCASVHEHLRVAEGQRLVTERLVEGQCPIATAPLSVERDGDSLRLREQREQGLVLELSR